MKKKILKAISLLILLVILIVVVNFGYKFFWYYKLVLALRNVINTGNYTNIVWQAGEKYDEETNEVIRQYSKMGEQVKADKKVSLSFSGYDENTKLESKTYYIGEECVSVNEQDKTFFIGISFIFGEKTHNLINYPILDWDRYDNIKEKLGAFFSYNLSVVWNSKINFIEEDGTEYLVLKVDDFVKYYFNKETLLAKKEIFTYGDEEKINQIYEIEVGNVTDKDVTIPDLSKYTQQVW